MQTIAVFDVGKTNAKVLLIDLTTGQEVAAVRAPNAILTGPPYPHYDLDGLWQFLLDGLRDMGQRSRIDAISVTTHGAAAVLLDKDGMPALPALDYEHPGPDEADAGYRQLRPEFGETGSPRLPGGLNLGAQICWQALAFPQDFQRVDCVLMYPQYWSYRLTGVMASEPTSLGCHTDLWQPFAGDFSSLVDRMGWRGLFPPVRKAGDVLGTLLPEVAAVTGLPSATPVICGIHDSNASLVPHLAETGPRAVLSTGTWMIAMALGGRRVALEPARDVLVNVNAKGEPVPTARYMAGREFDEITQGRIVTPSAADEEAVLRAKVMALPSLHRDTGPFPGLEFGWTAEPQGDAQRTAAASFYAALMGAECLALIGAEGPVIIEGPFGGNGAFARMLATATGRAVIAAGQSAGTGLGAALLASPVLTPKAAPATVLPESGALWTEYVREWRAQVSARWAARQAM